MLNKYDSSFTVVRLCWIGLLCFINNNIPILLQNNFTFQTAHLLRLKIDSLHTCLLSGNIRKGLNNLESWSTMTKTSSSVLFKVHLAIVITTTCNLLFITWYWFTGLHIMFTPFRGKDKWKTFLTWQKCHVTCNGLTSHSEKIALLILRHVMETRIKHHSSKQYTI